MIKKLDLLIIRSFMGPFVATFFVCTFVLVMQFFWLYMDELVGKGLGVWIIAQLLFYMSFSVVPIALPLAILLAAIMTFGNMGEFYELVAIKSTGISLLRFMRPLLVVSFGLSIGAFFINNNLIPVANLKSLSLLYDLRNSKPTFNIRPGVFNKAIDGYAIRVGAKEADGQTIRDVLIYDHTAGGGSEKVVVAKEGRMMPVPGRQMLVFRLQDGWRYQEGLNAMPWQQNRHNEGVRMHFRQWDKLFDLSSMQLKRTNEDLFKNAYQMLNITQLGHDIDSLRGNLRQARERAEKGISVYYTGIAPAKQPEKQPEPKRTDTDLVKASAKQPVKQPEPKSSDTALLNVAAKQPVPTNADMASVKPASTGTFLDDVPAAARPAIINRTLGTVRNLHFQTGIAAQDVHLTSVNLLKYEVAWHQKLSLSLACILMYLIGAPLGAIVRKGGLGLPTLYAIMLFLVFYFLSNGGKLLAEAGALPAWAGVWSSTLLLLPVAFWLIRTARNDKTITAPAWLTDGLVKPVVRFFARKLKLQPDS